MLRVRGVKAVLFCAFLLSSSCVFAATFSVSVTPYAGGYDLRYDKITPALGRVNRELTVNISSDIAKQYRLTQILMQPLSTPEGSRVPENSFVVYALRGSNKYGTMNVEQEVPVMLGRQLLYTSNQTGTPDSFTLVYSLLPDPNISSGYYKGRLAFTLEPIDSSQAPQTVFLDIYAQFEAQSAVEIKTATGTKDIVLQWDNENRRAADVVVEVKGGFGKPFRILQLIQEQPISPEGNLLDWQAVGFTGSDAQRGTVINTETPLSAQQQVIYNSSPSGEADTFVIQYKMGDFSKQKAGRYRTSVKYFFEGIGFGTPRLIDALSLEIDNPRIFDIMVYPENQKGAIEFLNLRPTEESPRINEVVIEVTSNIARQYQVTQSVLSDLVNKEGDIIRSKYFTLRTEGMDTKGTLKLAQPQEVQKGNTVLFISDKTGSGDKFKVVYELAASRDIKAGDYSTRITYSLSEI